MNVALLITMSNSAILMVLIFFKTFAKTHTHTAEFILALTSTRRPTTTLHQISFNLHYQMNLALNV